MIRNTRIMVQREIRPDLTLIYFTENRCGKNETVNIKNE